MNNTYLCNINQEQKNFLIEIKVNSNVNIRGNDQTKLIKKIITQALDDDNFRKAKKHKIDITAENGKICYSLSTDTDSTQKKVIALNARVFPKYTSFNISKISERTSPTTSPREKGKKQDPIPEIDPHDRLALEQAMEEVAEVISNPEDVVAKAFEEGLKASKEWKNPKAKRKEIAQKLTQVVLNLTSTDPSGASSFCTLPSGYWKDKNRFEPILWSFKREDDGSITLLKLAYGEEKGKTFGKYTFKEPFDTEKLEALIFQLLQLPANPTELREMKKSEQIGQLYVQQLKLLNMGAAPSSSVPDGFISQANMNNFIEGLCIGAGGIPQGKDDPVSLQTTDIKEDPLKLIWGTINTQSSDAGLADKILFSLQMLNHRLNKVLNASNLSDAQRKQWLLKLEKDYKSMDRQLQKSGLNLKVDETLPSFKSQYEKLQRELLKLDEVNITSQKSDLQVFNKVAQQNYALEIQPKAIAKFNAKPSVKMERLSDKDYLQLNVLSQSIRAVSAGDVNAIGNTVAALTLLTDNMNALLDAKQHDTAITLYRTLMADIPVPGDKFWQVIQDTSSLNGSIELIRQRSEQIKAFSDQLGKLGQYFWESKLKSVDLKLKPDEWIYMLNTEAAIRLSIESRVAVIKSLLATGGYDSAMEIKYKATNKFDFHNYGMLTAEAEVKKAHENNQKIIRDNLTFEEECFLTLGEDTRNEITYNSFLRKLNSEKHLRPGEHPLIAAKYRKIEDYLRKIRYQFFTDNPIFAKSHLEQDRCETILTIANERNMNVSSKLDKVELWRHYLQKDNPDSLAVPTQFGDLSRHQLMFTSMLYSRSCIARYVVTGKGLVKFTKGVVKNFLGRLDPDLEAKRNLMEALALIGDSRLEIIPMHHSTLLGAIENWGIVPKGTPPGTIPTVAITPGGVSDMQMAMGVTKRDDIHQDLLRQPNEEIYDAVFYNSPQESNNEPSRLVAALNSDYPNPLEFFLLQTLKGRYKDQDFSTYQSVHEVFDLILQRPWLLDSVSKNSEGEDSFEAQKRFYEVLFSPQALDNAIEKTPEFFLSHAGPVQFLLDKALQEKKTGQYIFLLYLAQSVRNHVEASLILDPANNASIKKKSSIPGPLSTREGTFWMLPLRYGRKRKPLRQG